MDLPLGEPHDPSLTTRAAYLDTLYQKFLAELAHGNLYWKRPDKPLSLRRQPEVEGRHDSFWHIVSGGSSVPGDRELDAERCVRIGWIRPMIQQFNREFPNEKLVHWWITPPRWNGDRYGLATQDFDYVIFVDERPTFALLVSAYYVRQPRRRRRFRSEHDAFWAKQEPPT